MTNHTRPLYTAGLIFDLNDQSEVLLPNYSINSHREILKIYQAVWGGIGWIDMHTHDLPNVHFILFILHIEYILMKMWSIHYLHMDDKQTFNVHLP
jgi:hypothetical protein